MESTVCRTCVTFTSYVAKNKDTVHLFAALKSLLDLDHVHIRAFHEADLASAKGVQECTRAANALLRCMSADIHPCMTIFSVSAVNISQLFLTLMPDDMLLHSEIRILVYSGDECCECCE